jgi:hypothetical protein
MQNTAADIEAILASTPFSSVTVPTCPTVNSCFRNVWSAQNIVPFSSGHILRPPDSHVRDGVVGQYILGDLLHIECTNLKLGFDTEVAKDVITRMRLKCKVSIFFTSFLKNLFSKPASWVEYTNRLEIHKHTICFLVLELGKSPTWLTVYNGQITLGCEEETEYLAVFICSGALHATQ